MAGKKNRANVSKEIVIPTEEAASQDASPIDACFESNRRNPTKQVPTPTWHMVRTQQLCYQYQPPSRKSNTLKDLGFSA